jgi:hypothetical protein
MLPLVSKLFQICLFRAKPQDLPASRDSLVYTVAGAGLVFVLRNHLLSGEGNIFAIAFVQIVLLGLAFKIILALFSKPERWLQSATALFGCSAVIVALVIPFLISAGADVFTGSTFNLVKIAILATSVWYFAVIVFILRETLEVRVMLAFVVAVVLEIALATALLQIFGDRIL